jgi:hypothetical protein
MVYLEGGKWQRIILSARTSARAVTSLQEGIIHMTKNTNHHHSKLKGELLGILLVGVLSLLVVFLLSRAVT